VTRVILVRHGQTTWNKEDRVRGQTDLPLDETGLRQAELTAARVVREWQPVAVYCSPLQRAVKTAAAIARRLNLQPQPVVGINDMNFGEWQGLATAELRQRWPEMARAWFEAPHTVAFPGGESLDALRTRAMAALNQIVERHPEEDVVIVAHMVVNRVLLLAVLGLDNSHYWRIGQETCAINVFRWHQGAFFIDALNDTCHLRENVPSSLL
jgi:broad specificity phosphatase PhoE